MKAKELIKKLERIVAKNPDAEVEVVMDDELGGRYTYGMALKCGGKNLVEGYKDAWSPRW